MLCQPVNCPACPGIIRANLPSVIPTVSSVISANAGNPGTGAGVTERPFLSRHCGGRHFRAALGVDFEVVTSAADLP